MVVVVVYSMIMMLGSLTIVCVILLLIIFDLIPDLDVRDTCGMRGTATRQMIAAIANQVGLRCFFKRLRLWSWLKFRLRMLLLLRLRLIFGSGVFEAGGPGQSLQHSPLQPDGGTRSALSELKTQIQQFDV